MELDTLAKLTIAEIIIHSKRKRVEEEEWWTLPTYTHANIRWFMRHVNAEWKNEQKKTTTPLANVLNFGAHCFHFFGLLWVRNLILENHITYQDEKHRKYRGKKKVSFFNANTLNIEWNVSFTRARGERTSDLSEHSRRSRTPRHIMCALAQSNNKTHRVIIQFTKLFHKHGY
jgi:hypothetical protein